MLSERMREKLRKLSRAQPENASPPSELRIPNTRPSPKDGTSTLPRTLERLTPGKVVECELGHCYILEKWLDEFWPDADAFLQRYLSVTAGGGARAHPQRIHPDLFALTKQVAQGALYFDIETCGFAGMPVFLIGTMRVRDRRMVLRQFLARDYGEEAAILDRFAHELQDAHTLVSFNGRSFDWPFVSDRAALYRLQLRPLPHVDLLHQARRSWKSIVPDHKLQTLEIFLCNRRRSGDIPGSEIPGAYHDFVRTGHATLIRDILQHNLLDLVTMAELVTFLLADEFPTP